MEDYWRFNTNTSSPMIEWDAFKAVMRGVLLHSIAIYRAELREASLALEKKLEAAESAFFDYPNPDTHDVFQRAQRQYTLHLTDYTQKRLLAQRQSIFADGDKNGKALAFLAKTETPQTIVTNIQTAEGVLLSNPRDICEQFGTYYAQLYRSRTTRSAEEISDFLDKLHLPLLSKELCETLNSPITVDDVQAAIAQMAAHKSSGQTASRLSGIG